MPLDKKDQWFAIYDYSPGSYGPRPNEPLHVWHPDACHPFHHKRANHRAEEQKRPGTVIVACGARFDDTKIVIVHPAERKSFSVCQAYIAAHDVAKDEHDRANAEAGQLRAEAREQDATRTASYRKAIDDAVERHQ